LEILDPKSHEPGALATPTKLPEVADRLDLALQSFWMADAHRWRWDYFDLSDFTDFQRDVLRACFKIPTGETLSYAALADKSGHCGAARAVGQTLAKNPVPFLIPCHRVLASGGGQGGFTMIGGLETKRWLLEREGVEFAR
jgi:methylated-DNA-[protein]-cysteine S-methyltransferase